MDSYEARLLYKVTELEELRSFANPSSMNSNHALNVITHIIAFAKPQDHMFAKAILFQ